MRLYVAVGSTAVDCLIELIRRYQEEGLREENHDRFIGLDTNRLALERLKASERDSNRVFAIPVLSEDQDSPLRNVFPELQPKWERYRKAEIPEDGVGGDRRLSYTTLQWTRDHRLTRLLSEVKVQDEVVLIGTAFGGTSTGLFWNVANWLRSRLARPDWSSRERGRYYGFLILPGELGDVRSYPWPYNFCAFMQEMQSLDLLGRIQRQLTDVPCAVPLLPCYFEAADPVLVPVWDIDRHGYSQHSFLPFDRLFLVPTPTGDEGRHDHVPVIVAEQALVLGPLEGWSKLKIPENTIDLMTNRQGHDYRQPDYAFGGFNMVVARSARRRALRAVFGNHLQTQLQQFATLTVKAAPAKMLEQLRARFEDHLYRNPNAEDYLAHRREELLNAFDTDMNRRHFSFAATAEKICKELDQTLDKSPLNWPDVQTFVKLVGNWWQERVKEVDDFISLADIRDVYMDAARQIEALAAQKEEVKNRLLSLQGQLKNLLLRRGRKTPVRVLGARTKLEAELIQECRAAIEEYFLWFGRCCRAAAARRLKQPDGSIVQEIEQLGNVLKRRVQPLGQNLADQGRTADNPACVYEDPSPSPDLSALKLPRHEFVSVFLDCVSRDEAAVQQAISGLAARAIEQLSAQAREMGPADPLRRLTLDLSRGRPPKSFSEAFAARDNLKYHHHFVITSGSTAPLLWRQFDQFSSSLAKTFRMYLADNPADNQQVSLQSKDTLLCEQITDKSAQGIWIGTLRTDLCISDAIDAVYRRRSKPINNWQNMASASVAEGGAPNTLLSLAEWIGMAVVLGAAAKKLEELKDVKQYGAEIQIPKANIRWQIGPTKVSAILTSRGGAEGQAADGGLLRLQNLYVTWISDVLRWVRGDFWSQTGLNALRDKLNLMDRDVLEQISLGIDEATLRKPLVELGKRLDDMIVVRILNDA